MYDPNLNISEIHTALVMVLEIISIKWDLQKPFLVRLVVLIVQLPLLLHARHLGKENVRAVLMPSPYSTEHSVNDAVKLSENLGNPYDIIKNQCRFMKRFLSTLKTNF